MPFSYLMLPLPSIPLLDMFIHFWDMEECVNCAQKSPLQESPTSDIPIRYRASNAEFLGETQDLC
jgi:hypothetical protein